jgi:hypothetical protein
MKRIRPASAAPGPATYHGVIPEGRWPNGTAGFFTAPLVVITFAVSTNVVVAALPELMTTGFTEKA